MTDIISIPKDGNPDVSGQDTTHHFGYYEASNLKYRPSQEDALAWHILSQKELTAEGATKPLTPKEIGHRLWTSYQLLEKPDYRGGTTAATTVYDGRGNLITAILADAAAFAVIYDKKGDALGVVRLNKTTHKPTDEAEKERIEAAGGKVFGNRVMGSLAVSRAIGDNRLKSYGVCSEANIDITNVSNLAKELNIAPENIGSMQIITTCDGFTDGAGDDQSIKSHEDYLLTALKAMKTPGAMSQKELSKALVEKAIKDGSMDNVSVAIQTITKETPPLLLGVYDGHGGSDASMNVAQNIGQTFKAQCALTPEAYAQQGLSINQKDAAYKRDNSALELDANLDNIEDSNNLLGSTSDEELKKSIDKSIEDLLNFNMDGQDDLPEQKKTAEESSHPTQDKEIAIVKQLLVLTQDYQRNLNTQTPVGKQIQPIINHLITTLTDEASTPQNKIKGFYTYLNEISANGINKNIDIIKQDKSASTLNFCAGIAIILATIATGIIPGLIVIGLVQALTSKSPLDLFKTNSERFENEVDRVRKNNPSAFFKSEAKEENKNAPAQQNGMDAKP